MREKEVPGLAKEISGWIIPWIKNILLSHEIVYMKMLCKL